LRQWATGFYITPWYKISGGQDNKIPPDSSINKPIKILSQNHLNETILREDSRFVIEPVV
jgi:hypothetical protein